MVFAAFHKTLFLALVLGVSVSTVSWALTPQEMDDKLTKIEEHLEKIDVQQASILQQQKDILAKLDVVKIWARRS